MQRSYTVVPITEGTSEWLEWRRGGIGSSDAPVIMGENPFESARQLLAEKTGPSPYRGRNKARTLGAASEPEARAQFVRTSNVIVEPACLQSTMHDWLRASVDGISTDGLRVVEIKCGESAYRKTAATGRPPKSYFGQLQHVLALTNLPAIDFYCYNPLGPPLHLHVPRDQRYIDRLLKAERDFWQRVVSR